MIYLIAFAAMVIGLVWTLYNQATGGDGAQLVVGIALFVIGQLTITAMAVGLRGVDPVQSGSSYHRTWQRLSLGVELPAALRLLVG